MWPGDPRCLSRPYLVKAVLHPVPAQLTHALPRGVFDQRFDARRGRLEEFAATFRPLGALANRFYIRTGRRLRCTVMRRASSGAICLVEDSDQESDNDRCCGKGDWAKRTVRRITPCPRTCTWQ
jgi:hypothetical protein